MRVTAVGIASVGACLALLVAPVSAEADPTAHRTGTERAAAAQVGLPTSPVDIVDVDYTADERGYWVTDASGTVEAHEAPHYGHVPSLAAGEHVSALAPTPSGDGYWLFTTAGRVFPYGDAGFHGDVPSALPDGAQLDGPVIDAVPTASGLGYYMLGFDGGIFTFGDATFHGSVPQLFLPGGPLVGQTLAAPVVGIAPTPSGGGYWLVASDGGMFSFGDAGFFGSVPGVLARRGATLAAPVTGMIPQRDGYLVVATDGGIFNFGRSRFHGSLGGRSIPAPIAAVAVKADLSGYLMVGTEGAEYPFGDSTLEVRRTTGPGWGTCTPDQRTVLQALTTAARPLAEWNPLYAACVDEFGLVAGADQNGTTFWVALDSGTGADATDSGSRDGDDACGTAPCTHDPEIGAALLRSLGATTEQAEGLARALVPELVLGPDGLGPMTFGTDYSRALLLMVRALGSSDRNDTLRLEPVDGGAAGRAYADDPAAPTIVFGHPTSLDTCWGPLCIHSGHTASGSAAFVGYTVSPWWLETERDEPSPTTELGIGVDSTFGDVLAAHPEATVGSRRGDVVDFRLPEWPAAFDGVARGTGRLDVGIDACDIRSSCRLVPDDIPPSARVTSMMAGDRPIRVVAP